MHGKLCGGLPRGPCYKRSGSARGGTRGLFPRRAQSGLSGRVLQVLTPDHNPHRVFRGAPPWISNHGQGPHGLPETDSVHASTILACGCNSRGAGCTDRSRPLFLRRAALRPCRHPARRFQMLSFRNTQRWGPVLSLDENFAAACRFLILLRYREIPRPGRGVLCHASGSPGSWHFRD